MSLFAHLEIEAEVQVNDRTRLKADKSFVTKGADPITTVTIQAGADGSAISVYNATDQADWFLDWEFDFGADISTSNNKLNFSEDGGTTELLAQLTVGTYTMVQLAAELQSVLNISGSNSYTVTATTGQRFKIEANGNFTILTHGTNYQESGWPLLGYLKDTEFKSTQMSEFIECLPRAVTLTIGDGTDTASETKLIQVYSVEGDRLFSKDSDLTRHESNILEWIEDGRNTFLDEHRRAQHLILAYLDRNGYVDIYGSKYTKHAFIDIEEGHEWSIFLTLRLICESMTNAQSDIFRDKAKEYGKLEDYYRDRVILRLDTNDDGKADLNEGLGVAFAFVARR